MLALIDFAAEKEDKKVKEKLAKRVAVAKIIEEKKMKRDERKGAKEDKIEQIKKDYLHNQKQKKTDAKKQKRTNKAESEKPSAPKKRVRFA
ncbi:hypothetical protein BDB01DRAFT_778915 [Pilobolus umbonatus]|nr:hypothetical protein BDB01DRAFT_778915 [Pilobolus umbonatus]